MTDEARAGILHTLGPYDIFRLVDGRIGVYDHRRASFLVKTKTVRKAITWAFNSLKENSTCTLTKKFEK